MQCLCGYSFAHARLAALQADEAAPFRSFMLVDDGDYKAYRRAEKRVDAAHGKDAKEKAVANVARYTGSLCECPACGRYVLFSPDKHNEVDGLALTIEKAV